MIDIRLNIEELKAIIRGLWADISDYETVTNRKDFQRDLVRRLEETVSALEEYSK